MKVLVLGGNGLFGRKTVINLVKDPEVETVVSMDITPVKPWVMKSIEKYEKKFHYVRGDVSELEDILSAIRAYSIDKLVNWAFLLPGVVERSVSQVVENVGASILGERADDVVSAGGALVNAIAFPLQPRTQAV